MTVGPWSDIQFAEMSWHDNHVHAMRIVESAHGAGELLLDVDYILEWLKGPQGVQFKLVPVTLRFRGVTGLRVTLDYATPTAAMGPFSIHAIERREEVRERYTAQCWDIVVNWPTGRIAFEADGFTQETWGKLRVSDRQYLLTAEREPS